MPGITYDLEAGLKFKFFPGGSENVFYVFTGFGILIYVAMASMHAMCLI